MKQPQEQLDGRKTKVPKLYTVKQVADALGFSTNTVYKYLEEGTIKATRLGKEGRFKIPEAEIIRLIGIKGDRPRLPTDFNEAEQISPEDSPTLEQSQPPISPEPTVENPIEETDSDYNSKLSLVTKVASPDLFDWFLSLVAIFVGIAYLLFPLPYQSIKLEPFGIWIVLLKFGLVLSGVGLLTVDVFVPVKKIYHHLLVRIPLAICFSVLAIIFYFSNEVLASSYVICLVIFILLSSIWQGRAGLKFIAFVYLLVLISGMIYGQDPQPIIFIDLKAFTIHNPGIFEVLLVTLSTLAFVLIGGAYFKNFTVFLILSFLIGATFFGLSISFMIQQSWNKAVIALLVAAFSLIIPFNREFDNLSRFTRRDVLISFLWMVLILFIGIGMITFLQSSFKKIILNESTKKVKLAGSMTEGYVVEAERSVNNFASDPLLIASIGESSQSAKPAQDLNSLPTNVDSITKKVFENNPNLKSLAVFDLAGELISVYPIDKTLSQNQAGEVYFQKVIDSKRSLIADRVLLASPVINGTQVIGVAVGSLDLSGLSTMLESIDIAESGEFVIADSTKAIILDSNASLNGIVFTDNASLIAAVEGRSGEFEGYTNEGNLTLQSYQPIPSLGWGIVAQQSYNEAFRESSLASFVIFLVTIISGTGTLMSVMYIKRRKL